MTNPLLRTLARHRHVIERLQGANGCPETLRLYREEAAALEEAIAIDAELARQALNTVTR